MSEKNENEVQDLGKELNEKTSSSSLIMNFIVLALFLAVVYLGFSLSQLKNQVSYLAPVVVFDYATIPAYSNLTKEQYEAKLQELANSYAEQGYVVLKSPAVLDAPKDLAVNVKELMGE